MNKPFYVTVGDDDEEARLQVAITDEGIVADLIHNDCLVGSYARTAQELTELIEWLDKDY